MASLTSIADRALKAFNASNYTDAITLYTKALTLAPNSPDYYLKRSTSYQRFNPPRYDLALRDAEYAVILAHGRGKRELIGSAQLRRGIALFQLKRYGDAKFCFEEAAKRVAEKEKNTLAVWEKKVEMTLEKLEEDDVAREVTVGEVPDVVVPELPEGAEEETTKNSGNRVEEATKMAALQSEPAKAPVPVSQATLASAGVALVASKIRHEWYQTNTQVVVTVYAKGVPEKDAVLEITEKMISISFPLASGSSYDLTIDPLFDRIDVSQSKGKVYGTKVELTLTKSTPGRKWADLEGTSSNDPAPPVAAIATPTTFTSKPAYPTSSKNGPKDWDKLAKDLAAKPKKADGEPADEEYDSDDGGDPVNFFFKKLYKDADDDTRRAMMKSYIESNGTALSTNWSEVGKGKVETSPPEGMEAKGWND